MPWRGEKDPYRIWVSEAMLQQTRVETVMGYYERFLLSFPTLQALAQAEQVIIAPPCVAGAAGAAGAGVCWPKL